MENEYTNPPIHGEVEQKSSFTDRFLFKTYLYLVVAFALAGITGIVGSYIFEALFDSNNPNALYYWLAAFLGSFLLIFVFTMIINIQSIRNRNSVVLLGLYSIAWGIFLSCFVFLLDNPLVVGGAFLITAVIFLGASVIGYFMSGKAHRVLAVVVGGLLIAVLLCCILNFVLIPFIIFGGMTEAYWAMLWIYFAVEAAILLVMIISVASTTYRLRHMDNAQLPDNVKNSLAVSVALSLFSSFISIFIRVLYILLILFGGRKK